MSQIKCTSCGLIYPPHQVLYKCVVCGGIFDFDGPPDYHLANSKKLQPGIWRYRTSFGLPHNAPVVSLGEGNTPLVWLDYSGSKVGLKMESQNPTGSYKDRGTAPMISYLLSMGIKEAVEDSSGNAGASFAAYAARTGIKARVFVPEAASGPKRNQIEMYGADLIAIPGPRDNAAAAVINEVQNGFVYASHAYLPFGLNGIATIAYEIWEQLDRIPGTVIAPAGHGGLLLGLIRGFSALSNIGLADKLPYFIGVQAENCSPIYSAFSSVNSFFRKEVIEPTIAEGVSVSRPVRLEALLREMPSERGRFVKINEGLILPAMQELAHLGFNVEPTSALTWCALQGVLGSVPEPVILVITGSGLKYYKPS
jgi:threonine synthase